MRGIVKGFIWVVVGVVMLVGVVGCTKDPYELDVVGYDYTDRAIADFSVNGAGGGNIELSTPTAGGGKYACCVLLSRNTVTPFLVDVVYQRDAFESYPPRKVIEPAGQYVKVKVEVKGPIPSNPGYLEIHFYPDGHIEGAISGHDGPSPPRLKLERRFPYVR